MFLWAETPHCPKIWGWGRINVEGIICPPGWNRVSSSAKDLGQGLFRPPCPPTPASLLSILIFVQKSCFLGARELVRRKVNIRAYWLPLTKENLFHRLRNWNLNAFHDVEARDLLQGISFQNNFFQPTNRIRNESWILRSPGMSICITYFEN